MAASFPNVTTNILSAKTPQTPDARSILIVGGMVSGTASSGALVDNLLSATDFNNAFGRTSHIAKAGRALIEQLSISRIRPKVSAIGLTDSGSGVAATGIVAFTGTATEAGTITVYIDSIRNGVYKINVASGATAASLGTLLETAINANLDRPVNAVNTTGSVALTAINKGTVGNSIGLKYSGSVAGITTTLTAFASGATNPTLTAVFDAIASTRYSTIIFPAEWGISTLTTETESKFNVDNKIVHEFGIVCKNDTYANSNTALDALNQKTLGYIPNKLISGTAHKGGAIFENPIVIAAYAAALRELRLTVNSNTSSITTNGQSLGGSFFAAIPYHNTPFNLLPIIETGNDFSDAEALELQNSGGWVLRNNPANTVIISNEAVTTYKTNMLGNADVTFKYINYFDTLTLTAEYIFNNLKADFSQHILTTGQLIAGRPMVNKEGFIAALMGYYATLSGINGNNNYCLLRAGTDQQAAFKKALTDSVVINLATGTLTAEAIANITTQVRNILVNFTPTFE